MSSQHPVFSVIVPIYKIERYLAECIESILSQTYKDYELILVDDGSPDQCPAICEEYRQKDSRIRVIHKENGGLVSTRKAGLQAAAGEYICYVDGDDTISPVLLETMYHVINVYAPDMIIFGLVKNFADHDEEISCELAEGYYKKIDLAEKVYPYMMYDKRKPFCKGLIFPAACNKIYKRELLLEHYCQDLRIRMGEDNAFVYECAWYSESIYVCNKILYFYRQHEGAMNHSYDPNRFLNNQYLFAYMGERLSGFSHVLDEQFAAFKVYWIIMAVFHEIKCGKKIKDSAKHLKESLTRTGLLDYADACGLPKSARIYIFLLKHKWYRTILLATKLVQYKRETSRYWRTVNENEV